MKVFKDVSALVGRTPLVELVNFEADHGLEATVLAKAERFNPGGSAKDRIALQMIAAAEAEGRLGPDTVIIEPTSGNTGVGLAMLGAAKGYRVIIVMPDSMSAERQKLMTAYGATLVLTPGELGVQGAMERAEQLHADIPDSLIAGQFANPANPEAHRRTTGPEIWEDTDGRVDIFVAGVGTGGTITGTAEFLKSKNPNIRIVGVEPAGSAVLSGGEPGRHDLQGIGAGFIPEVLNTGIIDEVIPVTDEQAYACGRELARRAGLLCGISSGAAVYAAGELAKRPENRGKLIVALLTDTGERYLSTAMFAE